MYCCVSSALNVCMLLSVSSMQGKHCLVSSINEYYPNFSVDDPGFSKLFCLVKQSWSLRGRFEIKYVRNVLLLFVV